MTQAGRHPILPKKKDSDMSCYAKVAHIVAAKPISRKMLWLFPRNYDYDIVKGVECVTFVNASTPFDYRCRKEVDVLVRNKTTLKAILLSVIALLIAYPMRLIPFAPHQTLLTSLAMMTRYLIHISLLIAWCGSLRHRLLNTQVRHLVTAVGGLLAFWLTARTIKYEFIADITHPLLRYLWYSYYIPMIFVPLLGVFVVYFIGKPENQRMPKAMYVLWIPAVFLIGTIFTNDWHQTVFSFPNGIEKFDKDYGYGFMYYIVMAWMILLSLYFVVMLLKKSRVPGSKTMQKLPLIIVLGAVAFWIAYSVFRLYVDLTAVDCLIIVCLLESAIQCGMVPSNTNYRELFEMTTLPMVIVDDDNQPRYASGGAVPLSEELLEQTSASTVDLGDAILHSAPITFGRVVWQSDVSKLNMLKEQLDSICEQLSEENTLLQAELDLKERRAKAEEKNRLYDRIAFEVSPQLERIDRLVTCAKADSAQSKQAMAKVTVFGAYIKRRGNLMLLGEDHGSIPMRELEFCLRESADNLELCKVYTALICKQSGELSPSAAIALYDWYEAVIEALFDTLSAVFVRLSFDGDYVKMRLQIGCTTPVFEAQLSGVTAAGAVTYTCQAQETDLIIEATVSRGGDMP
ncbi:MAG: hypothetical protein E7553_05035 [Ruminococcaceae bacterium]|nr:hypothetical protein [Oscillospiraceae bacterium]